jgi:tRNA A37 threonylcarbamoyladenosine biosynthesis protein TsaE
MTNRSSPATIAGYLHTLMGAFAPASAAGMRLGAWLVSERHSLPPDVSAMARGTAAAGDEAERAAEKPLDPEVWRQLRTALAGAAADETEDATSRNIAAFAEALGLAERELSFFRFVFHASREDGFDRLCQQLVWSRAVDSASLAALVLGCRPAEIRALSRRGPLAALGLVHVTGDGVGEFGYATPWRIRRALQPPNEGMADIERQLIGEPLPARLAAADYAHLAREHEFLLRLLRGSVAAARRGVNVLIYGAPGTGKTEFCRLLAAEVGCDLFAIGEVDDAGSEPCRGERLEALRLADRFAGRRGRALLLFDEMEDLLQDGQLGWSDGRRVRRAGSKVFFNRLLEQNGVPVLWTANTLCEFDPAFLRRMSFALEMPAPPATVRARLWGGLARQHGVALSAADASALGRRYRVAPGLMASATQAVAAAGGGAEDVEFVVKALARPLVGRLRPAETAAGFGFDPALTNADADLSGLMDSLAKAGAPRDITLCLYGPPGTGKSAFARKLAERMGLDALVKRGSDLLSMWVGETERLIAEAFDEALKEERFLVIDEAETFLWNRGGAERSWEVSRVNELLVAMESHPLPFACTTISNRSIRRRCAASPSR